MQQPLPTTSAAHSAQSQGQNKSFAETGTLNADTAQSIDGAKQLSNNPHHVKGRKGLVLIAAGVVLCVSGFVLVITQQTGTVFNFALYGMTGAGGSCIMGGLALIMG